MSEFIHLSFSVNDERITDLVNEFNFKELSPSATARGQVSVFQERTCSVNYAHVSANELTT
jgi:hypothetical protein